MAEIILPRRFKGQSQYNATIDRQGLGKGVQLLFNPALGPVDLATGRVWVAGGNAAITTGQRGRVFSFDGVDDYYAYTGYPEITSNVGTFFIWMPRVGPPDAFGHVYLGASSPVVCGHQVNESNQIIIGTGSSGSSGTLPSWFNTTNRSMVLVSDGTAAGTKAFVDGKDTGFTWGSPPTAWGTGNKNFNFGRYVGGVNWDFDGTVLLVGMTSAVWGAAEARAFHQNPWQLYKSPSRRLWSVSAGGTTHDLAGADATQVNTASAGAVSQDHALSVQTSAQANSASGGTVTQTHDLVGSDATQPNAASTGAITQAHALSAQPSVQANSVSADAISQAHALDGATSTQTNTASIGAISQGAQFSADPATQPNTANTGAITQAHALTVAGSTQPQEVSAASIAQAHALAGASATQANTSPGAAISTGVVHNLVASQSTQANAGSAGAISQAHILVSAPSIQDNVAAASSIVQAHVLAALSATQSNSSSAGAITAGDNVLVSTVERTATFRRAVTHNVAFRRAKSVTVRFN